MGSIIAKYSRTAMLKSVPCICERDDPIDLDGSTLTGIKMSEVENPDFSAKNDEEEDDMRSLF